MPRTKKTAPTPPPTIPTPSTPSTPAAPAQPPRRHRAVSTITQRERRLAIREKARKNVVLRLTLREYEEVLEWAESWEEEVTTVVRACLRRGMEAFRFAGTPTPATPSGVRPFAGGMLSSHTPPFAAASSVRAPVGPLRAAPFVPPPGRPLVAPPESVVIEDVVETVFGATDASGMVRNRRGKRVDPAGLLPQAPPPGFETPPTPPPDDDDAAAVQGGDEPGAEVERDAFDAAAVADAALAALAESDIRDEDLRL